MQFRNIGNLHTRRSRTGVVHGRTMSYSEQCMRNARLLTGVTARWLSLVAQGMVLQIFTAGLPGGRGVLPILDRTSPLSRNSRIVPLLSLLFRRVTTTSTRARLLSMTRKARQRLTTRKARRLTTTNQVQRLTTTSLISLSSIPRAKTWHRQNGARKLSLDRPATWLLLHPTVTILDTTPSLSRTTSDSLASLIGQAYEAPLPPSLR
jgi:hypothetical protein